MIDYFNLNQRYQHSLRNHKNIKALGIKKESHNTASVTFIHQVFIYISLLIGIVLSDAVLQYIQGGHIIFNMPNIITVIICIVVALVVFPNVYSQIVSNPPKPILIQMGIAIQNGVFFQVVFKAMSKTITG